MLLLLYPFINKRELLPGFPSTYQKKLLEQEVQDVGKINKIKFQPYVDLVDQAYSQLTRL